MPTKMDLAVLSSAVYGELSSVPVPLSLPNKKKGQSQFRIWKRIQRWHNNRGFLASLYVSDKGERVFAFAGTDDFWDLVANDTLIAVGIFPPQGTAAINLVRQMHGNVFLTGHSLGGALAILAAAQNNLPAVTFNSPGILSACLQMAASQLFAVRKFLRILNQCMNNPRVKNFGIAVDVVFNVGMQTNSREKSLSNSSCSAFNMLCRHKIQTVIHALSLDPESYKPVVL